MGVLGIYIHNMKDLSGNQAHKGGNPFDHVKLTSGNALSSVIPAHDPPYTDSKDVYAYIKNNLPNWIEKAIEIRNGR